MTVITLAENNWALKNSADGKFIQAPIAVLGHWEHPVYGEVEFTQEDFDAIQANFNNKVLGYEPPLFVGHPEEEGAPGSAPSVAFPYSLVQEGDVLFGNYEAVNDKVYEQVVAGEYRYSSAEVVPNARSKETGEEIGTVLIGCALTNRPFLTRMPRVKAGTQAFSDVGKTTQFNFPISVNNLKTKVEPMPEETQIETPKTESPLDDRVRVYADQVASLLSQVAVLQENVAKNEAQAKAVKLATKLDKLEKMTLSESIKTQYSEVLKNDLLNESQEEEIFKMLFNMSEENKKIFTRVHGSSVVPSAAKPGPYDSIIAANETRAQKLAEQRQSVRL